MTHIQARPLEPEQQNPRPAESMALACDQCGNVYDKSFQILAHGRTYTFDSFECAIALVAPRCSHCQVPIIGHGLESEGRMFCCDHCAEKEGVMGLRDRA